LGVGKAEKCSFNLILVREETGNSAASPNSIIHDLIFITPDGSTSLNEIQGVVCVGCGSGRSKPFAAAVERKPGFLDALLDVELSHQYDLEGSWQIRGIRDSR